jgi:hypothetical protein
MYFNVANSTFLVGLIKISKDLQNVFLTVNDLSSFVNNKLSKKFNRQFNEK